jgi:iron complex outermembrane recepter protein
MFKNKTVSRLVFTTLIAGAVGNGLASPEVDTMPAQDEDLEVIVTGSRIQREAAESFSPVTTITAADMDARGYSTVLEALNDLPQNTGGGFDQQYIFGFTPSASAIDLRGFGLGRSLILIDGRRVPVFPLAFEGTDNFVDLSSIPVAAIERIEILPSGASAIYGSDAMSGVVNIILKKSADNELSLRQSDTTQGGGATSRVQLSKGFESAGGTTASFFAEYFKQGKMMFTDRDISRSDVLLDSNGDIRAGSFSAYGFPGTFVDAGDNLYPAPNCTATNGGPGAVDGICMFNRAFYRELLPDAEHFSLTAKLNQPVNDTLSMFAAATYFTSNVVSQYEPVPADSAFVSAGDPNNPVGADGFWVRRTVEFGPRSDDTDNHTYNVVAGLQGKVAGRYDWQVGTQYAEQRVRSIKSGYMLADGLAEAVTDGLFDTDGDGDTDPINLFDAIPQNVVDAIRAQPRVDGISSVASLDFQLTGDLFDMPHGAARFAVAAEHAKQRFEDKRDADTLAGNIVSAGATSGGGSRKYSALGLEIEVPILEKLSVNLAGRYDHYDDATDVGGAFSPRVALQYQPVSSLLLRASAGKSFRAPDLQRVFGAETTGFEGLVDTPLCIAEGGAERGDTSVPSCTRVVQDVGVRMGANLELEEETGDNVGLGLVWNALPRLTMSADLWYTKLQNIVNSFPTQIILDRNAATGAFDEFISRDTPPNCLASTNPGCLDVVISQAQNLSFQRARGVDGAVQYLVNTASAGELTFRLAASYVDRWEMQQAALEPVVDVLKEGILGEFVRFKGNATAGWRSGPWQTTLFINHIGPFTPENTTSVDEVGSYTTVNLTGSFELPWNGSIQAGVNNLFDKEPPLDLSDGVGAQPFYNWFFHDALGSTWWLRYSQKF